MGDAKEAPGAGGPGFAHHPLDTGAPAPCAPPCSLPHTFLARTCCSHSMQPFTTPAPGHARAGTRAEPPGRQRDAAPPASARLPRPGWRAAHCVGAGGWNLRRARGGLRAAAAHREAGEGTRALRPPPARPFSCFMHARTHECTHARMHAHTLTFSDLPRPCRAVGSSGRPRRRRRRHGAGGRGCGVRGGAAAESILDEVMDSVPADQGRGTNSQKYSVK